jgi:hypothetical protein
MNLMNKTHRFSGLDNNNTSNSSNNNNSNNNRNSTSSSFANAVLALLYFVPELRSRILAEQVFLVEDVRGLVGMMA